MSWVDAVQHDIFENDTKTLDYANNFSEGFFCRRKTVKEHRKSLIFRELHRMKQIAPQMLLLIVRHICSMNVSFAKYFSTFFSLPVMYSDAAQFSKYHKIITVSSRILFLDNMVLKNNERALVRPLTSNRLCVMRHQHFALFMECLK